jgi:hypothetical protein
MCCVLQKSTKRGATGISAARSVVAVVLQVIEEGKHKYLIEVGKREIGRFLSEASFGKTEQQLKRVSIGRDRARAKRSVVLEMIDEKALQ